MPIIGNILHNTTVIRQGHNKVLLDARHIGIEGNEKADECAAKAREIERNQECWYPLQGRHNISPPKRQEKMAI